MRHYAGPGVYKHWLGAMPTDHAPEVEDYFRMMGAPLAADNGNGNGADNGEEDIVMPADVVSELQRTARAQTDAMTQIRAEQAAQGKTLEEVLRRQDQADRSRDRLAEKIDTVTVAMANYVRVEDRIARHETDCTKFRDDLKQALRDRDLREEKFRAERTKRGQWVMYFAIATMTTIIGFLLLRLVEGTPLIEVSRPIIYDPSPYDAEPQSGGSAESQTK